jgi:hypothetical protein
MNDRPSLLLVMSAAIYGAAGLLLLFAPDEALTFAGAAPSVLDVALLQLIGSALFGFAMLNWLNRHSRIGGIFGRPVVVANLVHAGTAALLLGHVASRASLPTALAVVLVLYGSLAVAFGFRLFVQPTLLDQGR